jgi:hypothetical protein
VEGQAHAVPFGAESLDQVPAGGECIGVVSSEAEHDSGTYRSGGAKLVTGVSVVMEGRGRVLCGWVDSVISINKCNVRIKYKA